MGTLSAIPPRQGTRLNTRAQPDITRPYRRVRKGAKVRPIARLARTLRSESVAPRCSDDHDAASLTRSVATPGAEAEARRFSQKRRCAPRTSRYEDGSKPPRTTHIIASHTPSRIWAGHVLRSVTMIDEARSGLVHGVTLRTSPQQRSIWLHRRRRRIPLSK